MKDDKISTGLSLISILGEKVIFAGPHESNFRLYEGSLNEENDDIQWLNLPSLGRIIWHHAVFYQSHSVHIVGGFALDNYGYRWQKFYNVYDINRQTLGHFFPKICQNFLKRRLRRRFSGPSGPKMVK